MNIPNDGAAGNPSDMVRLDDVAPLEVVRDKLLKLTTLEFFKIGAGNGLEGTQAIVTMGPNGALVDHYWNKLGTDFASHAAIKAQGRRGAYFSMAVFNAEKVSRFKGRTSANAIAVLGFWIDVEGSAEKFSKPGGPEGGYPNGPEAMKAVGAFKRATELIPNLIVLTGSGGVHLHYVLDAPITPAEWRGRAKALVALAKLHGFKIDAQCTTDVARIMRAPGSLHQKTGEPVTPYQLRKQAYSLGEFDHLVSYAPETVDMHALAPVANGKYDLSINSSALTDYPKYSYLQASEKCPAMRKAAQRQGADTTQPVWILAIATADRSIEGRALVHAISCGHTDYGEAATDKTADSLTGGPAGCAAWESAYGVGGPCDTCEYRGQIKNPAIQLGALVDTTPPGSVALTEPETVLEWVGELNTRFALVRHGSKVATVDFQTPCMSSRGVTYSIDFLDVAGLRTMLNGRFAPVQKAGDKLRPLADAWLAHPQRRQYEGLVYAPGEVLPPTILNLWQGFAVEPVAGDVSLWLEVLAALVPNEAERLYVLRWIAWKIQNPGGVPDTILIFKGAKGTGKNSLFDPLISLFGRHAMLADDPELIAGRFTWHLMSLSFAVLDEAVFVGDPKQADRVKSRVTAKTMHYEPKGLTPVQGVNRCAYVMLTNHEYVWHATSDERRAVVLEVGERLRGDLAFWNLYHAWALGVGPAALLHYLQVVDLTGFNPRKIPKGEALREQVEQTALREPVAAWWHQCLSEAAIRWRDITDRVVYLNTDGVTEIDSASLRLSFEQSAAMRGRTNSSNGWPAAAKRIKSWLGSAGTQRIRPRVGTVREWRDVLPPLACLRAAFTEATQIQVSD